MRFTTATAECFACGAKNAHHIRLGFELCAWCAEAVDLTLHTYREAAPEVCDPSAADAEERAA